jgi:hypothetical protein
MTLSFLFNKEAVLAFSEQYLKGSSTHQKARNKAQWLLPMILMSLLILVSLGSGVEISSIVIYGGASLLWYFCYPKQFDASMRKQARKLMEESSYEKSYGEYRLSFDESGIQSSSPLGESRYTWDGMDRVEITDDYLYVFLAGPVGYPIPITDDFNVTTHFSESW